jgi:hypothetical protein
LRFLRIIVVLHTIGVFAQAVFAGRFLSGLDGAVYWHEAVGWVVLTLCLAQTGGSAALRVPRGATLPFTLSSGLIFMAEALQAGTGYGRFLEVHIPLGALLVGGVAAQLMWVFRG